MRRLVGGWIVALLVSVMAMQSVAALAVPSAPSLAVPIVDQTATLSDVDIQQLSQQIRTSRTQKSYQIGILMIPTLGNDEYLEGYSLKVAREWGIGEAGKDNGVLILVVKNDQKMRIEVGRGVEGDLTDVRANRIIRNVMAPAFRNNDFAGGLSGAIGSIDKAVSMQADHALTATNESQSSSLSGLGEAIFFGLFLISGLVSWVGSMLARSKSWWAGGVVGAGLGTIIALFVGWVWWSIGILAGLVLLGLLLDYLVSRDYVRHKSDGTLPSWWAGGGSIGSGGGWSSGGGSFGGGGFSGGGSSGSW
ncbi:MAG: TPM domain-containing protein [Candidatus Saccharimonas sp.]|nr:TPM domain-containing protein [Candidatus Saccharimonas sp.]